MVRVCRYLLFSLVCALCVPSVFAVEPCRVIHGRARIYTGDGNLRIWHIGTDHEFEPADGADWDRFTKILLPHGLSGTQYDLYADFTICPTEPFKAGSVQRVIVKAIKHPRVVPVP
jgi:hypothetical protein